MEEKLDLCEILKNCPIGTRLYSVIHGTVEFGGMDKFNAICPICIKVGPGFNITMWLTRDGRYMNKYEGGECILFPSKYTRTWSNWVILSELELEDRYDPSTLGPFDRILVHSGIEGDRWNCALFNRKRRFSREIFTTDGRMFTRVIPYCEGTKFLLGTTKDAPKFYRWWEVDNIKKQ